MRTKNYIPHSFNALASWLSNFWSYLNENLQRFGIAESKLTVLEAQIEAYRIANEKAEHPNAGKADRLDRKEKAGVVSQTVRSFVNEYLRYNSAVTDDDRINLGLHVPDTKPTAMTKPETWPLVTVRSIGPRQLRLDWHDSDSSSRAKPSGIHGCEIRHAILDSPPASNDDLLRSEFSTRSSHVFVFDESQRGKIIYFCLRWESTRGEKGPWSEIISAVIS